MATAGSRRTTRRRGLIRTWSRLALLPAALLALTMTGVPAESAATPSLRVLDASVTEHDAAGLVADVKVQLSVRPTRLVTVDYTTANGTASAPADYTAKSGTLRFRAGEGRTQTVSVPIKGDLLDEANETFRLKISNPYQARIADGNGVVTIVDNDPLPRLRAQNVAADEEDAGTFALRFPVALSVPSGRLVTVSYAITPGSATLDSDYTVAPTSGTLRFPAGTVKRFIAISVIGDTVDETPETVNLSLVAPVNAALADGSAVATIRDDDGPGLAVNNATTVTEGAIATFTVSLPASSPETVTVSYATANGSAVAPGDYVAKAGTLTFAPGETSKTVTVSSVSDSIDEVDEYYYLNLSNPVNAEIADASGYTYIDDNDGPGIRVNDAPLVVEGSSTVFTVSLTAASPQPVGVSYATANGTALASSDYTGISGVLTFTPGQTSRLVTVTTLNDAVVEEDEYLYLNLGSPVDGSLVDSSGYVYIDGNASLSKAVYLGSVRGDDGADSLTKYASIDQTGDSDWYRFELRESEFGIFDDDLGARVQLVVGDYGVDTDLCVYIANGSQIGCSSQAGTADEQVYVSREDSNGDDTIALYVRVFPYASGTNSYTLRVLGNQ